MTTQYARGYAFERKVVAALTLGGYSCIEARGSHGAADIVALKPGQVLLVQVKRRNPLLPPADRIALFELARHVRSIPVVAYQPAPRKPIAYRRLVGTGPKDWQPFLTDERAVSMALRFAALVAAVRAYITEHEHQTGGCDEYPCRLCVALAEVDRPKP